MYKDPVDYLKELEAKIGVDTHTYKRVAALFAEHKNLRVFVRPYGLPLLCTTDVNDLVDRFTVERDNDGTVIVCPTTSINGISCDQPAFAVAYRNPEGLGEIQLPWKEEMAKAGLPRKLIGQVESYLGGHPEVSYDAPPVIEKPPRKKRHTSSLW